MSDIPTLQICPGRGLGFLSTSLHDVLTKLKSQPHIYTKIHLVYSRSKPLQIPVVLNLPANGFRLRFDGPDQRLRLIEVLDFSKTRLSYEDVDLVKIPDEKPVLGGLEDLKEAGPAFRHVYNRLMGPTFPGEYIPPDLFTDPDHGLYVLSYPGIAFTFPLKDSAWSPDIDFVSLLSSSAAASARSMAIFNGQSWPEARHDLFERPCPNPRSLVLSTRGRKNHPDEVDLVKISGNGKVDLIRRSSPPFKIILGQTTPQDLVAALGPPDAIYRKHDHRLSIHKARRKQPKMHQGPFGVSPSRSDDLTDTDHSSMHTTTDDSEAEDDQQNRENDRRQSAAKCFYNYFHHGFDVFISYPSTPSPPFPAGQSSQNAVPQLRNTGHMVATKLLIHANVPGSYPFNRYRRSRWVVDDGVSDYPSESINSEMPFEIVSERLRQIWKHGSGDEASEIEHQKAIVLDRDWGDSPGSSYELLGGWEETADKHKKNPSSADGPGFGNTQLVCFPGMIFEVLKNDAISCLTVY
ncbi:MAG: hypothetical protein LQ342_006393 [Letrouitia transgressa]|nr:MAG: hypothetical protein LQ342_006393 [Letrouitia transgressa]